MRQLLWGGLLAVSVLAATFGVGEADGPLKHEDLGAGMGGNDLSKLSYLMTAENEAKLKVLLSNVGDAASATALGGLAKSAGNLAKISDPGMVNKLLALASAPPAAQGKDGVNGINGQPGPKATKVTVARRGQSVCKDLAGRRGRMVRMARLVLLVLVAPREIKAQRVLVVPLATLAPVVRRVTRVTLVLRGLLAPLVTVVLRGFRVILDLLARLASVVLSGPRVTLVRLVPLG